jgi:hypothetical protein
MSNHTLFILITKRFCLIARQKLMATRRWEKPVGWKRDKLMAKK